LAYTFGKKSLNSFGLNNLRVYLSGNNLYTWTKWSGWDPDVQNPLMKSFVVGINVGF